MNKHKHLEFIQAVMARLSEHSFRLKTFSLVQVGAIAAFVAARDAPTGAPCLLAPAAALALWYLDARFLRDERAYRALYEKVRLTQTGSAGRASVVSAYLPAIRSMTGSSMTASATCVHG